MDQLSTTSIVSSMEKNDMREISARFKEERKRLGLSQEDAAKALGVSTGSLGTYERNKVTPPILVLLPLFKLGADIQYIVTGERALGVLPEPEQRLITAFRSASSDGQAAILTTATALSGVVVADKKQKSGTTQIFNGEVGQNISGGFKGDLTFHFGKK
jgi:transcriptional regulator with XRE-family HTH domain